LVSNDLTCGGPSVAPPLLEEPLDPPSLDPPPLEELLDPPPLDPPLLEEPAPPLLDPPPLEEAAPPDDATPPLEAPAPLELAELPPSSEPLVPWLDPHAQTTSDATPAANQPPVRLLQAIMWASAAVS
jgi:hypothetical protein